MPKSSLEINIEKATNENNVSEDWGLIMDIVDLINQSNSEKEAIKIITRRLNDKDPHVSNHTLTLLNACVKNCNKNFKLAVCSGLFIDELRQFILKRKFFKLSDKLATMIQTWSNEDEFQKDPALNLVPSLYLELKKSGVEFPAEPKSMKSSTATTAASLLLKKEEEDLARAIQLSIKETSGSSMNNSNTKSKSLDAVESQKVKALYDFEAVVDNEITFKAGDILYVTDSADPNWWSGYDKNGKEGLFPSNFVTADLSYEIETFETKSFATDKKVSFNNSVDVKELKSENEMVQKKNRLVIDEKKIDYCIELLQNADPTGEIQPDTQEMLDLEEECYVMGPLIDQQLQKIDYKHATLEDINLKILEAFQMYNNLMKDSLYKTNTFNGSPPLISGNVLPNTNAVPTSNFLYSMNPIQQANPISFVAAPPQTEASAHMLSNQLNNFASNNLYN